MAAPARHLRRRGVTLMELGVAVILIGIMATFTIPSFARVSEQNRVDAAAQYLRSLWSAERVYWLENRSFTGSLATLDTMGLIDPKLALGDDGNFQYTLGSITADGFKATATRNGSGTWSGTLTITQDGEVTGHVTDGSTVLAPPGI